MVFYVQKLLAATCLNGHYASGSSFNPEKVVQKLVVPSEFATLVTMTKKLGEISSFDQCFHAPAQKFAGWGGLDGCDEELDVSTSTLPGRVEK